MPTIQFQMCRPSMRMNSVANSASRIPARKCPIDELTERAPVTSTPLSCCTDSTTCCTMSSNCSGVTCSGPSSSQARKSSHATTDCAARSPEPRTIWEMPRVSSPPTPRMVASIATVIASHLGQPWRRSSIEKGTSSAESSTATSTGMIT